MLHIIPFCSVIIPIQVYLLCLMEAKLYWWRFLCVWCLILQFLLIEPILRNLWCKEKALFFVVVVFFFGCFFKWHHYRSAGEIKHNHNTKIVSLEDSKWLHNFLVTWSQTFHNDNKAIEFAWWSVWSWSRTWKCDLVHGHNLIARNTSLVNFRTHR